MAFGNMGNEGSDPVCTEIREDLVVLWTREVTTIATFGKLVENDQKLLKELIECVHTEKDVNATKVKLAALFGTSPDRKSVVIRARLLSRLIAIAFGLHPDDIVLDSRSGKESLRPSVDFTALRLRLEEALQQSDSVLKYLFEDVLEADDEVMTITFCGRHRFEKYQVPYFSGCEPHVVLEISNLWLSQEFRRGMYYSTILEPLFNQMKIEEVKAWDGQAQARNERAKAHGDLEKAEANYMKAWEEFGQVEDDPTKGEDERVKMKAEMEKMKAEVEKANLQVEKVEDELTQATDSKWSELLPKAAMMLCELLQRRTVKAGARLLEMMLWFPAENAFEIVNELAIPLLGMKKGKFRKCFLGDFENMAREAQRSAQGFDQVPSFHGQLITVGPSCARTDSNLLCWAARRGYSKLIECISHAYKEVKQMSPQKNPLKDVEEALTVSLLWKVALWCAIRHGQYLAVLALANPPWVKDIDFNDYTGIQRCLPPLHLVALLGDQSLLGLLRVSKVGIESGAHKRDYLGKTPLDYAMQFQLTPKTLTTFEDDVLFPVIINDFKGRVAGTTYRDPIPEFPEWLPSSAAYRGYNYDMPYRDYRQMPNHYTGHQTVIQQLLQMPGVADRLKELNDVYIAQANFVLISAALIASVAFVGWLQPPLGYADYFQFSPPSPLAPAETYEQYVAVEGHLSVQWFVVFNALSFFLGIGTMLIGVEVTLFVHDNDERTVALKKIRKSMKWMLGFFITSMMCIMAAFMCAGLAILPPILKLKWSMIVSLGLGACSCLIPLTWILHSLARQQIAKFQGLARKLFLQWHQEKKLVNLLTDLDGALVNKEDVKALQELQKREGQEQLNLRFNIASKNKPWKKNPTVYPSVQVRPPVIHAPMRYYGRSDSPMRYYGRSDSFKVDELQTPSIVELKRSSRRVQFENQDSFKVDELQTPPFVELKQSPRRVQFENQVPFLQRRHTFA